jgi:hypothetical protein
MWTRAFSLVREVTTDHVGTAALGCPVERSSTGLAGSRNRRRCSTGGPRAAVPTRSVNASGPGPTRRSVSCPDLRELRCSSWPVSLRRCRLILAMPPVQRPVARILRTELPGGIASNQLLFLCRTSGVRLEIPACVATCRKVLPGLGGRRVRKSPWLKLDCLGVRRNKHGPGGMAAFRGRESPCYTGLGRRQSAFPVGLGPQ